MPINWTEESNLAPKKKKKQILPASKAGSAFGGYLPPGPDISGAAALRFNNPPLNPTNGTNQTQIGTKSQGLSGGGGFQSKLPASKVGSAFGGYLPPGPDISGAAANVRVKPYAGQGGMQPPTLSEVTKNAVFAPERERLGREKMEEVGRRLMGTPGYSPEATEALNRVIEQQIGERAKGQQQQLEEALARRGMTRSGSLIEGLTGIGAQASRDIEAAQARNLMASEQARLQDQMQRLNTASQLYGNMWTQEERDRANQQLEEMQRRSMSLQEQQTAQQIAESKAGIGLRERGMDIEELYANLIPAMADLEKYGYGGLVPGLFGAAAAGQRGPYGEAIGEFLGRGTGAPGQLGGGATPRPGQSQEEADWEAREREKIQSAWIEKQQSTGWSYGRHQTTPPDWYVNEELEKARKAKYGV